MFYAIEWVVKKIYYKASDLRDYPQKNSFIACSDIVTSPFLTTPPLSPSIVHGSSSAVSNLMCFVWTKVIYSLEISCARTALSIFALSMWFPGFFISVSSISPSEMLMLSFILSSKPPTLRVFDIIP